NNGTTLWFAQANQVANGVAERTVSGLLPAVQYQFRFESAWIGAGAPNPAANNAIYRLDILDGTTVLASRTRNVSNGSSVFPGGVLTEDLPPLPFIAPSTGAVTIRFTDLTTGGAVNDRDLFLMPLEVRTAALTVTATPFLRRLTFDCDGTATSTRDLALDGVTPYTVQGQVGSCTGDGSSASAAPGPDTEVVQLCDTANGASRAFLRRLTFEPGADTPTVTDTALDGTTPYTPAGTVGVCQPAAPEDCHTASTVELCDAHGTGETRFLRHYLLDCTSGDVLNFTDTTLDGDPYTVTGTAGQCSQPKCPAHSVLERCAYDDTDGDGLADTGYVELYGVDCTGAVTLLGTYTPDLATPYTPVSPVDDTPDDAEGAEPAFGAQAHRVELAAGASWNASARTALQSVTAVAHGGTGTVTTADGPSTLHTGEAATWSVARETDAALTGPLTITADSGTVTITWTRGVTLS
ncbi:hypothetical protein GTY54_43030, partial [Streptomyces sp. SID625]|nr:hypothetical protein [Streptomyces sp. SID625]